MAERILWGARSFAAGYCSMAEEHFGVGKTWRMMRIKWRLHAE